TADARTDRLRQPLAADVLVAVADQYGVCVRPFTMEVGDRDTGELRYVPLPCGSTLASICGPCARKATALRMAQGCEGWHLTQEPTLDAQEPSPEQRAQLTTRADLVAHYRNAVEAGGPGTSRNCGRPSGRRMRNFGNSVSGAVCPHPSWSHVRRSG